MSSPADDIDVDIFANVDEKALAGADFTADIIGELRRAFDTWHESGRTQTEIADRLGVAKSAVHRWLYGDGNMTLRKLGELIWAMDCRAQFALAPFSENTSVVGKSDAVPTVAADASAIDVASKTSEPSGWFCLQAADPNQIKRLRNASADKTINLAGQFGQYFLQAHLLLAADQSLFAHFSGIEILADQPINCLPANDHMKGTHQGGELIKHSPKKLASYGSRSAVLNPISIGGMSASVA